MTVAAGFNAAYLAPSLAWFAPVCPTVPVTPAARLLLLAIAGQESNWKDVAQTGGPARGPFQFEPEACSGVLANSATTNKALVVCALLNIHPSGSIVYHALIGNPRLATAFARLYLWADPHPLPPVGDEEAAWNCYVRTWRPGKPSRTRWSLAYPDALEVIVGAGA